MEFAIFLLIMLPIAIIVYLAYLGISLRALKKEVVSLRSELSKSKGNIPLTQSSTKQTKVKKEQPLAPTKEISVEKHETIKETPTLVPPSSLKPAIMVKETQTTTPINKDSPFSRLINAIKKQNPLVVVGLIVLLSGVSFMLKVVAQAGFFPLPLRLACAGFLGMGLLGLGWKLRIKKPDFALPVQGAAIGILFLDLFASYRIFDILPPELAMGCSLVVVVLTAILAVLQSSQILAVFAIVSGFIAPIAMSSGSGNYIGLFSFYAILNLGVFFIAWFKSWRMLNTLAFVFTYAIATSWGVFEYSSENFWPSEFFLILFYFLFSGVSLLFAQRKYRGVRGYVDGALVFALPIVTFSMQSALVENDPLKLAFSAGFMALHYLGTAYYLFKKRSPGFRPMAESMMVMGTLFGSLAVPLAFSGQWTTIAWAFEGTGLLWMGIRQNRKSSQIFGVLLLLGSGLYLLEDALGVMHSSLPFLNPFILTSLCSVAATWIGSFLLSRKTSDRSKALSNILLSLALINVTLPVFMDLRHHFDAQRSLELLVLWFAMVLILQVYLSQKLRWSSPLGFAFPLALAWIICTFGFFIDSSSPLQGLGWLLWPLISMASLYSLYVVYKKELISANRQRILHGVYFYLVPILVLTQLFEWFDFENDTWTLSLLVFIPTAYLYLFRSLANRQILLPMQTSRGLFLGKGLYPALVFLCFITLISFSSKANPSPLPWVPVLNPLDCITFSFVALWVLLSQNLWVGALRRKILSISLGMFTLAWTLITVARSFHHFGDLPYRQSVIWDSFGFQAGLSIVWTALALAVMIIASKKHVRTAWIAGAVLLGVVLFKLFTVDLSGGGSAARIISFMGVGLLIVIVGYFSPLPPVLKEKEGNE
jgi:uncharacterized membrane protein